MFCFPRILRFAQAGLYDFWEDWHSPWPRKCMEINKKRKTASRLSLAHLSSAFLLLCIGYGISLVVFVWEKVKPPIEINKETISKKTKKSPVKEKYNRECP